MPSDKIVGSYTAKMNGFGKEITYYKIPLYSKGYQMPFAKKILLSKPLIKGCPVFKYQSDIPSKKSEITGNKKV